MIAATSVGTAALAIADSKRVAVLVPLAVNVTDGEADQLGGALAAALNRNAEVVARGGAAVRAQSHNVGDSCMTTPSCVVELSHELAVDAIVSVVAVRVGDELQLDVALLDGAIGTEAGRAKLRIVAGDQLGDRFDGIAATLLPRSSRPLPDTRPSPPPPGAGRHITTTTWMASAVAVAGYATAAGFGFSARSRFLACDAHGPCDSAHKDSIATRALVADVALGCGLAATGLAIWSYWRSDRATEVTAAPTPGGAMLTVAGRF
jgi:hypothetical protein